MDKLQWNKRVQDENCWLVAIVLFGFVVRVVAVIVLDIRPEQDYLAYQTMALNLIKGKGMVDPWGDHAMYNMGYPFFILAPVFAVFGDNLLVAQLVNSLLGAVSIAACYCIAREAGARPIGSLIAAALWAVYLPSSVYAEYLAKENLMTPLMLAAIWCALRLMKQPSVGLGAICGGIFGFLGLTGNAGLSLVPVATLGVLFAEVRSRYKFAVCLVACVVGLFVIAPWLIRNILVLGAPVLNTNDGFNLYLGNNPAATGYFVSIADTPVGPNWQALRRSGEIEASDTLRRRAILWIRENPHRFLSLAIHKVVLFWIPPVHAGKGPGSSIESVIRNLWLLQYLLLLGAATGSALTSTGRTRYAAILWLSIAFYTAIHALFVVIYRYREPIMPVICVLAAFTVEQVWIWSRQVKFRLENLYG